MGELSVELNSDSVGLSLQFLVGDTEVVLQAMAELEFDRLDEPGVVERCADLSLHIEPRDLDTLSRCMARFNGLAPIDLRPNLTVSVDSEDGGALEVAQVGNTEEHLVGALGRPDSVSEDEKNGAGPIRATWNYSQSESLVIHFRDGEPSYYELGTK